LLPESISLPARRLFYGSKRSISQAGQDFWVFGEAFNGKRNGYFLEVGSADGLYLNNTFLLETRYNWRGICVEANPSAYATLRKVRKAVCLNLCVDSKDGEAQFVESGLFGGIVDADTDNTEEQTRHSKAKIIKLQTTPLASILRAEKAPATIDYFSLDVEGAEDRVLCEFPFDSFTFRCITIERPKEKLREILRKSGYLVVKEIPRLDVFFIHESFSGEYVNNVREFWERWKG